MLKPDVFFIRFLEFFIRNMFLYESLKMYFICFYFKDLKYLRGEKKRNIMAPSTNRHESTPELQRPLKTTDSSGCCCCLSVNSLPSIWFGIGAVSLQVLKGPNVFVFTCISYPFVFCLFGFIRPGVHYLAEWEDLFRVHGLQVQYRNQYMGTESVRRASRSRPSPFTHSSFCFRL